ncbi:uncharacterized protein LOC119736968 [Patiria miniata]|uniref:Uncharacterized protein n=1 Tax=Patiria miniata TaxID=46514 RepID=A0A914AT45_PATMI|nr:uncharacterized protein LOC119736968 [Patiria miniata]
MKTPGLSMLLFACMLFVAGIGSCAALDCYTCSFPAGNCGDPFDPAGVSTMTCPSGNVCTAQKISSGGTELYSRSCTEPSGCTPGCITSPEAGTVCSYCCNEDLCNSRSIADAVEDILHCYLCAYSSDPSASNISSPACNDPFDPNGDGVVQFPCADGQCGVLTTNYMEQSTLNRLCISNSTFPGGAPLGVTPRISPVKPAALTTCATGDLLRAWRRRPARRPHRPPVPARPPSPPFCWFLWVCSWLCVRYSHLECLHP